jgi:hypothetical protein
MKSKQNVLPFPIIVLATAQNARKIRLSTRENCMTLNLSVLYSIAYIN